MNELKGTNERAIKALKDEWADWFHVRMSARNLLERGNMLTATASAILLANEADEALRLLDRRILALQAEDRLTGLGIPFGAVVSGIARAHASEDGGYAEMHAYGAPSEIGTLIAIEGHRRECEVLIGAMLSPAEYEALLDLRADGKQAFNLGWGLRGR